jgi:transcriptional regulator with XRE-family HTH domain
MKPRLVTNPNPLVQRIFERAAELGLSDYQLAKRSGYGSPLIYYWRHRRYRRDRLQILIDLATTVGLEVTLTEIPTTKGKPDETVLERPAAE